MTDKKKKSKKKKPSKEKGENYLIKINPSFLEPKLVDNKSLVDKKNNLTKEGADYCVDIMKSFIDVIKERMGGSIGEKILISYNSEDFHKLSELKNTFKSNHWSSLDVYILLKKKIEGRRLDSILHNIKDYSFVAWYPDNGGKIVTQGYVDGKYDTGYFAPSQLAGDVDEYISDENNPMSLSLKKYKEVIKTLSV